MRNLLALAFLSASAMLAAGDLTGTWTGTLTRNSDDGTRTSDAYVILKQDGAKLTGSGGPSAEEQIPMSKVVMDGDKITFEVDGGNGALKFAVVAKGDTIEGDVVQERSDGTTRTGKIALKRKQ
ncbi:MAG: hypothetical protein JST65_04040 [Acidobacteria bacterium]|nr:hypothetical protein [Acidobacteriota bacterium]